MRMLKKIVVHNLGYNYFHSCGRWCQPRAIAGSHTRVYCRIGNKLWWKKVVSMSNPAPTLIPVSCTFTYFVIWGVQLYWMYSSPCPAVTSFAVHIGLGKTQVRSKTMSCLRRQTLFAGQWRENWRVAPAMPKLHCAGETSSTSGSGKSVWGIPLLLSLRRMGHSNGFARPRAGRVLSDDHQAI